MQKDTRVDKGKKVVSEEGRSLKVFPKSAKNNKETRASKEGSHQVQQVPSRFYAQGSVSMRENVIGEILCKNCEVKEGSIRASERDQVKQNKGLEG